MNPFNLSGKHHFWNCNLKKPNSYKTKIFPDFFVNYSKKEEESIRIEEFMKKVFKACKSKGCSSIAIPAIIEEYAFELNKSTFANILSSCKKQIDEMLKGDYKHDGTMLNTIHFIATNKEYMTVMREVFDSTFNIIKDEHKDDEEEEKENN